MVRRGMSSVGLATPERENIGLLGTSGARENSITLV